jgi:hypothetical protein
MTFQNKGFLNIYIYIYYFHIDLPFLTCIVLSNINNLHLNPYGLLKVLTFSLIFFYLQENFKIESFQSFKFVFVFLNFLWWANKIG